MERRLVVATVIAAVLNICAAAYGFGGLILTKLHEPAVAGVAPVVAAAPGVRH